MVAGLLPGSGRVLDLGCGTGRLIRRLTSSGYEVVGADSSLEMLRLAGAGLSRRSLVQSDAFGTPFSDASFDSVVALRLAFHYPDLLSLLEEMFRVVVPSGTVVFDTYIWSARSVMPLLRSRWGDKVYTHRTVDVAGVLRRLGLTVEAKVHCFLFSPYVYRLLPLSLVNLLPAVEAHVPSGWLSRVFWGVKRIGLSSADRNTCRAGPANLVESEASR